VAFQTDQFDHLEAGWSVQIIGRTATIHDRDEQARLLSRLQLATVPDGGLVAIELSQVTGCRLRGAAPVI
jgi:hypothetical protein